MKKIFLSAFILLLLLTGCGSGANSAKSEDSNTSETNSAGRLFGGKCADNQTWLANLEAAITVPANWQSVYDLVDHSTFDDYWGIGSEGSTFSMEESAEWQVYTARIRAAVLQQNYSEAIRMYELLLPLMEKMDLQCAVAVTGEGALSSTIVP